MKTISPFFLLCFGCLFHSALFAQFGGADHFGASSLLDQLRKKGNNVLLGPLPSTTDPRLEELVKQLKDPSTKKRIETVKALGELGEKARAAAPELVALLSTSLIADSVKHETIVALVKIDSTHITSLVPNLADLFAGRDTEAKKRAAAAIQPKSDHHLMSNTDLERFITLLHYHKQQASRPLTGLTALLPPSKQIDRETALFILPALGHSNPTVRRKTAELLEKAETRTLASVERALLLNRGVDALKQTVVPEARPKLEQLLKHETDSAVKSAVHRALKHVESRF